MKIILYSLLALVFLSACKSGLPTNDSQNSIKKYINGELYTKLSHREGKFPNQKFITDTIIIENIPEPLYVMISNDTVWFNSTSFTYCYDNESFNNEVIKLLRTVSTLNFLPINESDLTLNFIIETITFNGPRVTNFASAEIFSSNYREYYTVLEFGRFFNLENIKEIQLYINDNRKDISEKEGQYVDRYIIYKLDKDLFKNIK